MPFHFTGARTLRPGGLTPDPVTVDGPTLSDTPRGRAIHLPGHLILPGIVDIHGDGFERHLAPRRGALKDLSHGLVATEAELAANGITTAVLAQFWSWEGGMRGPEFARAMTGALAETAPTLATDMRLQLRVETHLIDDHPAIEALIDAHEIRFVVFNDHLPHAALAAGKTPPRLTGQALKSGRSPGDHWALLKTLHARRAEVPAALDALCARLAAEGVLLGSHDDETAAMRETWAARGVTLSEFPTTEEASTAAAARGDSIVLGAPNVVRGGSHAGRLSARAEVLAGRCTALASDYHYPAPLQAALALAPEIGLARAWALVSANPARILGLSDRGTIAPGRRADLTILDEATGRVAATLAQGRFTYLTGAAAAALL